MQFNVYKAFVTKLSLNTVRTIEMKFSNLRRKTNYKRRWKTARGRKKANVK